jgi:adenylate kinase
MIELGVIMELDRDEAIVMTHKSKFIIIQRSQEDYIGKTIPLDSRKIVYAKKERNRLFPVAVGVVAAVFIFIIFINMNQFRKDNVYAYIGLDINPSLELPLQLPK